MGCGGSLLRMLAMRWLPETGSIVRNNGEAREIERKIGSKTIALRIG